MHITFLQSLQESLHGGAAAGTHSSSLLMGTSSADRCLSAVTHFAFGFCSSLPWPEGSAQGDRQPLGGFDRGEKVKMPPGSTPVVHFTMCMSRDRRGEVSKAVQMADVTISKTHQSLLWCLVSKRWAAVLLWNLRAHYCLLFKQWWLGLTALFKFFSTHIYKFNTVLHSFNCLLLLTPMEGHRNSQSCKKCIEI